VEPACWELAECIERLRSGLRAPGRLRLIADPGSDALLGRCPEREPPAAPALLLGTALGMAWAEASRQGAVLALATAVPAADDPALVLAQRLGLGNVHLIAPWPDGGYGLARLGPDGWQREAAIRQPQPQPPSAPRRRREWPPVNLASLPRSGEVPWPAGGEAAPAAISRALAWLEAHEQRLLLPHAQPPWCAEPLSPTLAAAVAQLAGEGRRVVWQLPVGGFAVIAPAIADACRRGLGPKLLLPADELPALDGPFAACSWMLATGEGRQAEAVLAWMLAHEDAALCELQAAGPAGTGVVGPYRPGSGRWLASGADGTVVAAAAQAPAACSVRTALAARGLALGVFECTSLAPPPAAQLLAAPKPLWLLTDPAGGLAAALAACGLTPPASASPTELERAAAAGAERRRG
jgi:hypothetical protein